VLLSAAALTGPNERIGDCTRVAANQYTMHTRDSVATSPD